MLAILFVCILLTVAPIACMAIVGTSATIAANEAMQGSKPADEPLPLYKPDEPPPLYNPDGSRVYTSDHYDADEPPPLYNPDGSPLYNPDGSPLYNSDGSRIYTSDHYDKPEQRETIEVESRPARPIESRIYEGMTLASLREVVGEDGRRSRAIGEGADRIEVYEWTLSDGRVLEARLKGGALVEFDVE